MTLYLLRVSPPRSLDVSEALECPGVVDVITAEDVPGDNNHSGEIFFAQSEVCDLCVACHLTHPPQCQNNSLLAGATATTASFTRTLGCLSHSPTPSELWTHLEIITRSL